MNVSNTYWGFRTADDRPGRRSSVAVAVPFAERVSAAAGAAASGTGGAMAAETTSNRMSTSLERTRPTASETREYIRRSSISATKVFGAPTTNSPSS